MSEGREFLCIMLVVLAGVAVFMTIAIGLANWAASAQCGARSEAMRLNHSYGFAAGCMIETAPGRWEPLSGYRVTSERKS